MQDMSGSAGMLRGWVDIWTTHTLWMLGTLTVSVGAGALVELLITERRRAAGGGAGGAIGRYHIRA